MIFIESYEIRYTKIGWIYRFNDNDYVKIKIRNLFKIWKYIDQVLWQKGFIKLNDKAKFMSIDRKYGEKEISEWFDLAMGKDVTNYIKKFKLNFISCDYSLNDLRPYRSYEIMTMSIKNVKTTTTVVFEEKDIQLLTLWIEKRSEALKYFFDINTLKIETNKEIEIMSLLKFAEYVYINKIRKITITFNSNKHLSTVTYPIFNYKEDFNILKFK